MDVIGTASFFAKHALNGVYHALMLRAVDLRQRLQRAEQDFWRRVVDFALDQTGLLFLACIAFLFYDYHLAVTLRFTRFETDNPACAVVLRSFGTYAEHYQELQSNVRFVESWCQSSARNYYRYRVEWW